MSTDDNDKEARKGSNTSTDATLRDGSAPSPVPGVDWQTFRNFVVRALGGDESVPAAVLTRVNLAVQGGERNLEQRDRQWWQDFFLRQAIAENLRAIDGLIGQYNDMANWHHEQAEKARGKMQEATDRLGEIDEFLDGAGNIQREVAITGKLDREKAIALLRMRGVNVADDADEARLMRLLIAEQAKAAAEKKQWGDQYDQSRTEASSHDEMEKENRRKAQELVEKRDAIHNGGYDAAEEERRLREVAEEYEADVRRKAAEIEKQKNEAAACQLKIANEKDISNSQLAQSGTEVTDFEALAGSISGKFGEVAANTPKESPPEFTPPDKPRPASPVSSA